MNQLDFNAFFQQLSNTESLIFIGFCLGAFLIGLLFGIALRSGKIRRLKKELKKKDQRTNELESQLNEQAEIVTQKEADLKKSAYDLNQLRLAADRYEQENNELNKQILELRTAEPGTNTDSTKVKALQQQVEYLKSRQEQLQKELDDARSGDTPQDSNRIQALKEQVDYLKNKASETPTDRLAAFEARLNLLETENASLKSSIEHLNRSRSAALQQAPTLEPDDQSPSVIEPDTNLILQPKTDLFRTDRELLLDQSRDDLNQIEGIGPFIEKKLNDIGVYSFEQIAAWTAEDIAAITRQLNYFEGRIEKDDWVGQAKKYKDNPQDTELPTQGGDPEKALTIVEGIGPKIAGILQKAGINSLEKLAQTNPADIEQILEQTDPRYQMHDPSTWPAQARLAANGNWEVLKDYQEELTGGRDID